MSVADPAGLLDAHPVEPRVDRESGLVGFFHRAENRFAVAACRQIDEPLHVRIPGGGRLASGRASEERDEIAERARLIAPAGAISSSPVRSADFS